MSDKEQQLTDQFLEAWRNAKDETTRKEILQKVTNIVPETLIPHFIDWLDDAPPLEMFKVIESYKENWSNSFFINITRNDTLRPKLIHWLEKIIQMEGILDEIELTACNLIVHFGRKPEEFDFLIIHLEEVYKKLLIPQEIREKAYAILWRLATHRNVLSPEQQAYLNHLFAEKATTKLFEDWSSSVQNKDEFGQRHVLRKVYMDNKSKKNPYMLSVLLDWLGQTIVPEAMTWALDAYIPDIIANDDYRKQILAYFTAQIDVSALPSDRKSNRDTHKQRQIACFIEEIATTAEELSPVITYYEAVTRTFDPSEDDYEQSVKYLRSLTVRKESLIPADVYTRLLLFLEKIPTKPVYDVKYHVADIFSTHPASANTHCGRTFINAKNEQEAKIKAQESLNDRFRGTSDITWMVKISAYDKNNMDYLTLDKLRELWSEMKGKPAEQSQLLGEIIEAKADYLQHNILPELLKWLEQTTVPEIVPALDIYTDVIMGDENTRKPIADRLIKLVSEAKKDDGQAMWSIRKNCAHFLHKIAITTDEVATLITYYKNISQWVYKGNEAYHVAIGALRSIMTDKPTLIAPDVHEQLTRFLGDIPHAYAYQLKYRVRGPVSLDEGTTIIHAEDEADARSKAMAYLRHFDDGYGGSQKEILSLTKFS